MDLSSYWDYIEQAAQERLEQNKTPQHVDRYGDDIEIRGAAGELAARLFLGLPPILHKDFDNGADFYWRGWAVDVKSTKLTPRLHHRFLQWPEWKDARGDVVLMTAVDVRTKSAVVVGWEYSDVVKAAPVNYERDYPCHEIPIPDLKPVWEFVILKWKAKEHEAMDISNFPDPDTLTVGV